jgi:transcriptional regulator with XRE-family HTH domain
MKLPEISAQLRARRQELGWSQAEAAARAGTSVPTLSRYESGWNRFELYTLRKLAAALNCDLHLALAPRTRTAPNPDRKRLVQRLRRLFWDHPLKAADLDQHRTWVVARVLELGNLEDVGQLRDTLGRDEFVAAVTAALPRLSPRTRACWESLLQTERMPCTRKFSRNTAWNS